MVVQLPDDGGLAVGGEVVVRLLEVSAADEPPEGRERRGVRRFEDEMPLPVDEGTLAARVASPQKEHEMFELSWGQTLQGL